MDRERRRTRDDDDEPRSRRGRDDDRSDRRSNRDDDDDRGRSRDRDDDDRGRSRSSRDDDEGGGRRRSSGFEYRERDPEKTRQRSEGGGDFDRFLKPNIKVFKPKDGDNRIRIVPPTWKGADHYGLDIHVHYGVGADRQSYLDLHKMLGKPDPINEERESFAKTMDPDDDKDKAFLRELSSTKRVLVYLIDRNDERAGLQAWAMPQGLDRDIVKISVDKETGEVLPIDHPKDGYDVTFERNGTGARTKYEGVSIARRSSPLGRDDKMEDWLDQAQENPLPDQLVYFDYDHIARAFGGKGSHSSSRDRGDDRGGRDRDRDDDRRSSRDRDDDRKEHNRDRGEDRPSSRRRSEEPELSWDSIHDMKKAELVDLIELKDLDINPREAKDDDDLADWVCDELGLKKRTRREEPDEKEEKGKGDDMDDKLAKMRERRRERD